MKMLHSLVVACALGAGVACGSDDPATMSDTDCSSPPRYGDVAAFKKCTMCHASSLQDAARHQAPPQINFDTYTAADSVASEAMQQVSEGRMPPPASGIKLTDSEKQQLYEWVQCGSMP